MSSAEPSPSIDTDDVRVLVAELLDGIRRLEAGPPARADPWAQPAGSLSWTRWETAEHLADDLLVYGATLAAPHYPGGIPFGTTSRRAGAPDELVHCRSETGASGIAAVLEAASNLFVAIADATPPHVEAAHVFGRTGPDGFVAMAATELVVHGYDLLVDTHIDWAPDESLCSRILAGLFPHIESCEDRSCFSTLLWATARIEVEGKPTRDRWRWYNQPYAP